MNKNCKNYRLMFYELHLRREHETQKRLTKDKESCAITFKDSAESKRTQSIKR